MSDTDPIQPHPSGRDYIDHHAEPPTVHDAEVDAAYWVLWETWKRQPKFPPNSDAIRAALVAAKRALAERR